MRVNNKYPLPGLPTFLMTASAADTISKESIADGFITVWTKPLDNEFLLMALPAAVGDRARQL